MKIRDTEKKILAEKALVGQMDWICHQNRWRSWLVLILEFIKSPGALYVFKLIKLFDCCWGSAVTLRHICGSSRCDSMQPAALFSAKSVPPPVNKCIFLVWSQYFPPRQWRLLFCPWLLSKLTWLNWLRANELLDWSCQAPQEVMLLHLWGATPATAAICCLGMSQGFKKKKKGKKSQNYRKYLRRCVYSDQLSVITHSDEHTHAEIKQLKNQTERQDIHIYTM